MPLGGLVTILLFLPNLLYLTFPPRERPEAEDADKSRFAAFLEILERIGQIACFLLPFFYAIHLGSLQSWVALGVMACALVFYYAGWARYMLHGRLFRLLFEPMAGVPLPMAVAPILYMAAASLLLRSWWLFGAVILLAIGHLTVSRAEYLRTHVHGRSNLP